MDSLIKEILETLEPLEIYEKSGYTPTDKAKWDRAIAWAKRTYDVWPSAYASSGASKKYKEMGGGWRKKKTSKKENLRRWHKEKWKDQEGNECGSAKTKSSKGEKNTSKVCRPSKKVSSKTPVTWKGKSKEDKEKMVNKKRSKEASTKNRYTSGGSRKAERTDYGHKKEMNQKDIQEAILQTLNEIYNSGPKLKLNESEVEVSEAFMYHVTNNIPLSENIYRPYTSEWFGLFQEARELYESDFIDLGYKDLEEFEKTDIGRFGEYITENGRKVCVPLDCPMEAGILAEAMEILGVSKNYPVIPADSNTLAEKKGKKKKDPPLNKPSKNPGSKGGKYRVFVKDGDRVKKITYGSREMSANWNNPEARKSFAARHKCAQAKDKTSAKYWSCRAHKDFGTNVSGRFW